MFLGFFKDKKREVLSLHSGAPLILSYEGLQMNYKGQALQVLRFSKSFMNRMHVYSQKGYTPVRADVRLVVAWKGEDDPYESAVLLPDLYLKKQK